MFDHHAPSGLNAAQPMNVKNRDDLGVLVCTPNGELHNLGCKVIESFLISKGFKVFNISPSVQAESVTSYIQEIEPAFPHAVPLNIRFISRAEISLYV